MDGWLLSRDGFSVRYMNSEGDLSHSTSTTRAKLGEGDYIVSWECSSGETPPLLVPGQVFVKLVLFQAGYVDPGWPWTL